jgi:hypothetical protein
MTMYIGPAGLTGEDGVRRIGGLTVHSTGQYVRGDWSGTFRPNGGNPIRTGNAVLQIGDCPVAVLVVDWRAAPSAGGNATLLGRGDWPL